jgi:RecG-like helicase
LSIRGAGELYGRQQSGLSDIGMEALKNLKLVEAARTEAFALVAKDPQLKTLASLRTQAEARVTELHFE